MSTEDDRHHSRALTPALLTDPIEIANREARNALRQFDAAQQLIESYLDPDRPLRLRPSIILSLHRVALDGLSAFAGRRVSKSRALEAADEAARQGSVSVTGLEELLADLLAKQLVKVVEDATGRPMD